MLIKCRECGKETSSEAIKCPHCGVPAPAPGHSIEAIFMGLIMIGAIAVFFYYFVLPFIIQIGGY